MFDVIVIGNVGIDTNIYYPENEMDFEVETSFTENLDYIGNSGGYSARGFAQLGYWTSFIGYVGDDHNGRFILNEFQLDGINTDGVFIDPSGTAHSINILFRNGTRKSFYDGKKYMELSPNIEQCKSILGQTNLAHFSIPNWARYLLPIAKELGLTISCDIQDVVDLKDPYREDFIYFADVIFFSSVNIPDPGILMNTVLEEHPEKILVSGMGAKGCCLGSKKGIEYFDPVNLTEPILDTTGAGDGLAIGFLSSYFLEDLPLSDSILRGQITARHTCSQKGSSSNLITLEELDKKYKEELSR